MTTAEQRDAFLQLGDHRLFTRSWTPSAPEAGRRAPILLFHDSLGCIELWRSFPERLAAATGRRVVAYDRLGFGRSDPHPDRLGLDFVGEEGRSTIPLLCAQLGIGEPRAIDRGEPQERYLYSRSVTISSGTSEVLRNLLAQQALGLPRS